MLPERAFPTDPFGIFDNRMDRLFDRFFGDFARPMPVGSVTYWPLLDVSMDAERVRVATELPGLSEKDFQVTLEEGTLVIAGEKKTEKEEKGREWTRRERSYGSFRRVVALPADILADKVEARFANGMLNVEIPRKVDERNRPRTIAVKAG
jgi:HSP20 family protein